MWWLPIGMSSSPSVGLIFCLGTPNFLQSFLFRIPLIFAIIFLVSSEDSNRKELLKMRKKSGVTFQQDSYYLSSNLLSPSTKSAPSPTTIHTPEDDRFIINLLKQERFSECSLVAFQDRFDNSESVDRILESVSSLSEGMKSAYTVKYSFPEPWELESMATRLKDLKLTVTAGKGKNLFGNISSALLSPDALPVRFRVKVSNYRRLGDQCLVVILMVNDMRPAFLQQIYNMLTPVYIPITRKDEDFYIFKTDPEYHQQLLYMRELPNRIKFKVAVGSVYEKMGNEEDTEVENSRKKIVISTVCFFCAPGGNPRLVVLPITEDNLPRADTDYFQDFVWDLNGKVLYVAIPYIRAKVEADYPWEGTSNGRRGNWKMMFENFLTVKFNFSYSMFVSTGLDGNMGGGGTGVQLKNGTWIGVTGDLISGRADLGIVIANTPKRIYYIDFTNSFYDIGCLTFVTAQPLRIYSPAALLWPFDLHMWMGIGLSTLLSIGFFYTFFGIIERAFGSGEKWSLSVQIQFILSTFLEQDSPVLPESIPLRIFVTLWIFFTMVVTTVYRSKMVTLLAFPVLGKLPKTFDDLAFSGYEVGFMKHGDSAYNTLAASTDPVYVKLVAEMEIFSGVGLECLEKVVKYKYGCIAYDFAMMHLRERNLSDSDTRKLVFAPDRTYNIWLGLGTEGKSIYRLNFGKWLSYTRQFHLADIWDKMDMYYNVRMLKLDWWAATNQSDKKGIPAEEQEDLTMKHMAGAFYVLIGCLIISSLAFVNEILNYHKTLIYNKVIAAIWSAKNAKSAARKWRQMASGERQLETQF